MYNFVYDIKTKVFFGKENLKHLGSEIKKYGTKLLFLYDGDYIKSNGIYDLVLNECKDNEIPVVEFTRIKPNPRHSDVQEGIDLCKSKGCNVILAVGGGSTMDSAKAIATGALIDAPIWDIVLGKHEVLESLPLIMIATLAATGSEMNSGGVISNLETNDKLSLRHPSQRPKAAFLNPEYTYTVGKYQTACGSTDILCHLLETYFSDDNSMYMVDRITEGLIRTVLEYGPVAYNDPENYDARSNLMWTSSWAINDFLRYDKSKTWTMHPIEHEISAYYDITHALGLAIIMPRYLRYIFDEKSLVRFRNLGVYAMDINPILSNYEIAELVIQRIEEFMFKELELESSFIPLGITNEFFDLIASKLAKDNGYFTSGYRILSKEDIVNILNNCL